MVRHCFQNLRKEITDANYSNSNRPRLYLPEQYRTDRRLRPSLRHPVGLAKGANDILYVANWGTESQPNARITKCVLTTQEWIADIGQPGSGDGQFLWPGGLVTDSNEMLYLTDQADSKIVVFDKDGGFIAKWGETGSGPGQLMGPSGLAFDSNENLFVSDTRNHRVQMFTKDGQFLSSFGSKGSGEPAS